MVYVKQGVLGSPLPTFSTLTELGLATGGITITPVFRHVDMHTDDFGPDVPADVMWMLAECHIDMTLVHYDQAVLLNCIKESMAGGTEGTMVGAGTPMGGLFALGSSTNHYMSLNITAPISGKPWRFPTAYLAEHPLELPLSNERTLAKLHWRAIPYPFLYTSAMLPSVLATSELKSTGVVLWTHTLDV